MTLIKEELKKYFIVCNKEEEKNNLVDSTRFTIEVESNYQYNDEYENSSDWYYVNITIKDNESYCEDGDKLFLAHAYIKWDGCTHWNFYGEDSKGEQEKADSYYHLCGSHTFMTFIYAMIAGIKVAKQIVRMLPDEDFNDDEYMKFEGLFDKYCSIKEVTKEEFDKIIK